MVAARPPSRGGRRPRATRADDRPLARHPSCDRRCRAACDPRIVRRHRLCRRPRRPPPRSPRPVPSRSPGPSRRRARPGAGPRCRPRRAGGRGRATGRFGDPLRGPPGTRPGGPAAGHPRRRVAGPTGRRAARGGPRGPRPRSGHATSPTAGRTSPDAAPGLRRGRAPRGIPGGRRQPRGPRRRDQQPQRLPGP